MAYNKTVWKDRVVERPLTFTSVTNADGTITLTPAEGTIVDAGTPITATNLNNIEDAVDRLDDIVDYDTNATDVLIKNVKTNGSIIIDPSGTGVIKLMAQLTSQSNITALNPANAGAELHLSWLNNIARLRYGGTGDGSVNGLQIHGPGEAVKLSVGNDGYLTLGGSRLYFNNTPDNTKPYIDGGTNGNLSLRTGDQSGAYAVLCSQTASVYLQCGTDVRAVAPLTTATFKPMLASAFQVNSAMADKENINVAPKGALAKVIKTKVYDYHLKEELEEISRDEEGNVVDRKRKQPSEVKKRKGLLLEEAPDDLKFGQTETIDLYAMNAILWQSIQELYAEVQELRNNAPAASPPQGGKPTT